jgi:hypothetical protein
MARHIRTGVSIPSRVITFGLLGAGLAALTFGAVHGARSSSVQARPAQVAAWRLDIAYYDCLSAQAHSLVHRGETVDVSMADPGPGVTLAKVVAPFAVLTDRARDHVVLTLVTRPGPGTCLGSVVMARDPSGTRRTGTGASLPGRARPPQTPL